MTSRIIISFCLTVLSLATHAELVGRAPLTPGGNDYQAYYDTLVDITWAANGGLPKTSELGFAECAFPGSECGPEIKPPHQYRFIEFLNTIEYLGASTWRLPRAEPLNGSFYQPFWSWGPSRHGNYDWGWMISAPGTLYEGSTAHELAHLYYNTLGNVPGWRSDWSRDTLNTGPFINFSGRTKPDGREVGGFKYHTSGSRLNNAGTAYYPFCFSMYGGYSYANSSCGHSVVLPVLDGDPLGIIPVNIDIKPGGAPNCFNINGHGVIPVAVLSDETFDAADIDVTTLSFGGLDVRVRGNKGPLCSLEDVTNDGLNDLICQFQDNPENWDVGEDEATLTGETIDGQAISGTDSICIVP